MRILPQAVKYRFRGAAPTRHLVGPGPPRPHQLGPQPRSRSQKMTPLQLAILFLTMATTAWSAAIAAPTAAPTTDHLHHAPPLDNATSSALDIINLALLNLAYTDTIPYGEVPSPAPSPLSYPSPSRPLTPLPPNRSTAARPTPRTTSSPAPTPCSARASPTSPRGGGMPATSRPPWGGASICGAERSRGSTCVRGRTRTGFIFRVVRRRCMRLRRLSSAGGGRG